MATSPAPLFDHEPHTFPTQDQLKLPGKFDVGHEGLTSLLQDLQLMLLQQQLMAGARPLVAAAVFASRSAPARFAVMVSKEGPCSVCVSLQPRGAQARAGGGAGQGGGAAATAAAGGLGAALGGGGAAGAGRRSLLGSARLTSQGAFAQLAQSLGLVEPDIVAGLDIIDGPIGMTANVLPHHGTSLSEDGASQILDLFDPHLPFEPDCQFETAQCLSAAKTLLNQFMKMAGAGPQQGRKGGPMGVDLNALGAGMTTPQGRQAR